LADELRSLKDISRYENSLNLNLYRFNNITYSHKNFSSPVRLDSPKIKRMCVNTALNDNYKYEDLKQAKTLENFKEVIDLIDYNIYSCPNVNIKKYFSQNGI